MKKTVAVIYGGKSAEHEVSLISGKNVAENLDREKFDVKEILIDKNGVWWLSKKRVFPNKTMEDVDIAFPVLHGTNGEDGKIQGLFVMLGVPYVGGDVTSSALAMDKEFSKIIWEKYGLPVVNFVAIRKEAMRNPSFENLNLKYPVFVKPANLGSSIGVKKVNQKENLEEAINDAFLFGDKVTIEEAVGEVRELYVSLLGNENVDVSVVGEIVSANEFFDYEAKYNNRDSEVKIPAPISKELEEQIKNTALKAFEVLGLSGISRVDFLLNNKTKKLYVSEINTMPGFTSISMYPKLWEASGLSYKDLLTKLITLGLEKHEEKKKFKV